MDAREALLLEAAASGNLRAVQQLIQTGVSINAQHRINQWSALHWATHRQHAHIVEFLLTHGANASLRNNKDQTPADLISIAPIRALYERHVGAVEDRMEVASTPPSASFVPSYIRNPVITAELMSMDEGLAQSAMSIVPSSPPNGNGFAHRMQSSAAMMTDDVKMDGEEAGREREVLVYLDALRDTQLLGGVFILPSESIQALIDKIRQELDRVPAVFDLARVNSQRPGVSVPINHKQYAMAVSSLLRSDADVLIIKPPSVNNSQ